MRYGLFRILILGAIAFTACDLARAQVAGEIDINCGGAALTATNGTSWSADSYFSGGDLVYAGDSISNTSDLGLYRSARTGLYGDFSYAIPVANGNYTLNLLFAELQYWNVGDRVFNVTVNGAPLLTNFDILTQAASRSALVKSFPISVTTGSIQIAVQGVVRRGILNGIQIVPAGGTTTPPPTTAGSSLVNINAGGNAFTGADGTQWAADQSYSGGDLAYTSYPISGSPDLQLYRSARRGLYGNFGYTIPLSNGAYNLKLRFAEILLGGKGQRVFNVNVNGVPVLTNFDIVADAGGSLIADDKTFPVTVGNGKLQIDVIGVVGFGLLNGIQVYPATQPTASPALSLSTTSLSFAGTANGSNPAAQNVSIANAGSGTLAWTAASNQTWLTVSPASGSGAGTLSVVPVLTGLAAGNYTAAVTVTAPGATGAPQTVNVSLSVAAAVQPPAASVSPNVLGFTATAGGSSTPQTFSIGNTGGGTLSWTASKTQSWLTLSAASGTGAATLSAQASAAGLAAGTYHDTISINGSAATIAVTFTVAAAVQPPALSVSPSTLAFSATASGSNPAAQSIAIANNGGGTLTWTLSKTQSWLSVSASSGSGAGTVFLSANVAGLAAGTYTDTVTVNAAGATPAPQTVAVTFTVAPAATTATQAPLVSINCGGNAMTGADGVAWTGDQYYSGGDLAYTGYMIGGSLDLSLFRSARRGLYGDFSYAIPVPNGSYLLKLRFAEIMFSDKGQRVFSVNVNGVPVLTNFDIIADAGATLTADDKQFPVTVSNGKLQIDFVGVVGRGLVNGIQVFPASSGTSAPTPAPTVTSFTATGTTLSWATTGATAVTIDNGVGAVATTGSTAVNPSVTTTYTLTATNSAGSVTRTATVTVAAPAPTITSFTATGTTLSWATTGATTVSIDNAIGAVATTGSRTVNPTVTTTYTLTATNSTGSVTRTATVTVAATAPTITSFTATGTTLSWATTGATTVSIDNAIGAVATTGSRTVNPTVTTTYTLTATNSTGSVTRTATVTVAAPAPTITTFTATGTTLSWATTGATTVSIDNGVGAVATTGSSTVNPAVTTTYTLTATNSAGSVTRTATVTVATASQPPTGTSSNTDQWTAVPNSPQVPTGGQTLYNGIQLPAQWPPLKSPTQASTVPSYILHPPAVIPINTGRQLFVDDFLIGSTNLTRVAHQPTMYPGNPVLAPGTQGLDNYNNAFPFSDGVWFDPADHLFKLWYFGGYGNDICYAYSTDGKNWIKPRIADATVPNTNIVMQIGGGRDSTTVVMDLRDPNPARKFKAFVYYTPQATPILWIYFSPDGIHWTGPQSNTPLSLSDRTTVFFNPFRNVWVESARQKADLPATASRAEYFARARYYSESSDLQTWNYSNPQNTYWTGPEDRDPAYPGSTRPPDLYTLDGVAYESLIVGMFSWYYPSDGPELVEVGVGFSRDGFNWVRPTRSNGPTGAFLPATNLPNTWNGYNTQSAGGGFLVVGDQLYFYFSGRDSQHNVETSATKRQTGLATLRRDGFYSMDAGATQGVLTTRPVQFNGSHLFVNVVDPAGQLQVEVLDANGNVIPQFSKANCAIISADKTMQEVTWNGASLASLAGQTVQFKFYLTNGSLYSFWVTSSGAGASYGYVAAGGPGFTSDTDTVGSAAGGTTATGTVAAPVMSPAGGTFSGAVTVTMSSTTGGAAIRYTTDGSDPSSGSTLYAAPLTLNAGATVKAKAFAAGMTDSSVTLGLFTVQADITPPSRGSGAPSGTLASGTTQTTLSLRTSESATCRYATAANTAFSAMPGVFSTTDGFAHTAAISGLTNGGVYTYYVRCRDANGNANTDDYVITFAVASAGGFVPSYQTIEAESGVLTAPMAVASDALASGGKYISTAVDSSGSVTYTINAPVTGTYYVWCRILSVDSGSDSFYVSADGGATDVFDTAENKWSGSWQWTVVNGRGSTGHALALNPRTFTLSAGTHTLTFGGRDPNTKMDQLIVTNDAAFVPNP